MFDKRILQKAETINLMKHKVNYVSTQGIGVIMAENAFIDSSVDVFNRLVISDPEWAVSSVEFATKLEDFYWGSSWQDIFFQKGRSERPSVYDGLGYALMHTQICEGSLIVSQFQLNGEAKANNKSESNQRLLNTLPEYLTGVFLGDSADADGWVEWTTAVVVTNSENIKIELKPNRIPLEVGTTDVWTTWGHIAFHGGLARIPYGASKLTIIVKSDPS